MFERKYRYIRSTANCHLYQWVDAPEGSKGWLNQTYFTKEEIGDSPPDEFVMRAEAE